MKKIFCSLIILFCAQISMAQIILVKDQLSGKPLEMVAVFNKDTNVTAVTNKAGKADISHFKNVDTIYIKHLGYKTKKLSYKALEEKNFVLFMAPDLLTLDQFVVSASRWQQTKRDVPQKISAIKPEDVRLHNPQTAADLLTLSGDVYMQKSQLGGGSPMIRGFATNRVLITVDNVRMNTAIFRSGNVQNVISIDPFAIENTEVIFGPGSIIYGSDALGGTMNFYTLKPMLSVDDELNIKVNLNGRYASANKENTGHIDFNVGAKKLASLTSFTYSKYDDLRMGKNGPDDYLRPFYAAFLDGKDTLLPNDNPLIQKPCGYDQFNLMQKLLYKHNSNTTLSYAFHYSETSDYSRYDRLIRPKGDGLRSAEWYYGPQKWMMNNVELTNSSMNLFYDKMKFIIALQKFEESRIDRDFGKNTRYKRVENVDAYSVNLDFDKKMNERHHLFYGAEYIYNKILSSGTDYNILTNETAKGPSRYPDGSEWTSIAAYINYSLKLHKNISLQTGVRYNMYKINAAFKSDFYNFPFTEAHINKGALIGSFGLVYNPHETWQFSLNTSTGFRSPNIDDIGKIFDSSPGSVVVPNPELKAEYAYNIDAGVAKRISEYVKIDATAFYTLLNDALVRRDFTLNGADSIIYDGEMSKVQAVQNAAAAYVKGIQGSIEISTPWGLGLSSHINFIKGEEELDNGDKAPMRHAPPMYGSTYINYTYNKVKASLYALYNGEVSFENLPPEQAKLDYLYAKNENGDPYAPAYTTFNFKVMYQISDILSLSSGVENITDVRYKPYTSGIAASGRNFILSVKASF